ncbi:MAG: HDOD domain-containing protein [Nitrospirae bacterium]|nr:MAG: HDOD domain-containing protein [Nitrospirota bacterium]
MQVTSAVHPAKLERIRAMVADRIATRELTLPLLPQVASQVMALANDHQADASRLSSLIHQDQALASQILRIANSPAYLPRSPIVTLQQAVAWLGMNMLANLALTVSLQNGIFRIHAHQKEVKTLWRQALATGLFAKEVARHCRQNVESAYLCGLLHTIGKPVLLHTILDIQTSLDIELTWEDISTLLEWYHVSVGSQVAEAWHLPDYVREAILYYQDYTQAPRASKIVLITHFADCLATHLLSPEHFTEDHLFSLPVLEELNFYAEDVSRVLAQRESLEKLIETMAI